MVRADRNIPNEVAHDVSSRVWGFPVRKHPLSRWVKNPWHPSILETRAPAGHRLGESGPAQHVSPAVMTVLKSLFGVKSGFSPRLRIAIAMRRLTVTILTLGEPAVADMTRLSWRSRTDGR